MEDIYGVDASIQKLSLYPSPRVIFLSLRNRTGFLKFLNFLAENYSSILMLQHLSAKRFIALNFPCCESSPQSALLLCSKHRHYSRASTRKRAREKHNFTTAWKSTPEKDSKSEGKKNTHTFSRDCWEESLHTTIFPLLFSFAIVFPAPAISALKPEAASLAGARAFWRCSAQRPYNCNKSGNARQEAPPPATRTKKKKTLSPKSAGKLSYVMFICETKAPGMWCILFLSFFLLLLSSSFTPSLQLMMVKNKKL